MRKYLFVLFLILLFPNFVHAQTQAKVGDSFAWDHDGLNLDHFEINFDFNDTGWVNVGANKTYKIPSMQLSQHTFYVRACATVDTSKCSDPLSMQFVLFDPKLPNKPGNLRIISSN